MTNKIKFLTKKYSMAITAGLFLSASSAQAGDTLMNNYSHCLIYSDSGIYANINTAASVFYGGVAPLYLTVMAGTRPSFNPATGQYESSGPIPFKWNMSRTYSGDYFSSLNVDLRVNNPESLSPNITLDSYSSISGPGISYGRDNRTRLGDIPAPNASWIGRVSCVEGSDYQFI